MTKHEKGNLQKHGREASRGKRLFLMVLPFMLLSFAFCYVPLFGWLYAFFDYKVGRSLFSCEFVGFEHFRKILSNPTEFLTVLRNTLVMSGLNILLSPLPALFAILLNELRGKRRKKLVQTMTTLPNFISWIIVYSLTFAIFSTDGMLSNLFRMFGAAGNSYNPLSDGKNVWIVQMLLNIWKSLGWNAIIYIAAISGIDQELYDAANVDGAGKLQRIIHITVPGLTSTFFVLLLLSISNLLSNGFDQYFVFHNAIVADKIEVLDYYVYKIAILTNQYSRSIAIGMAKSLISVLLLFAANTFSKKVRGESIV